MSAQDSGETHPAAGQLLEDDREGGVVDLVAPVLVGNVEPEQTDRLHRLDEPVRILVAVLHLRRDRYDLAIDEFPNCLCDESLILVQVNHGVSFSLLCYRPQRPMIAHADLPFRPEPASGPPGPAPGWLWFRDAPASARRCLLAAWLGWLLDGFDVMLYALAFALLLGAATWIWLAGSRGWGCLASA